MLRQSLKTTALFSLIAAGCATPPEEIPAQYVSEVSYQDYTCDQLQAEANRVSARTTELHTSVKKKADDDAVQMGVGLILFWPTLFFLEGGDGPQAAEYARLKGEADAIDRINRIKNCGIQPATSNFQQASYQQPLMSSTVTAEEGQWSGKAKGDSKSCGFVSREATASVIGSRAVITITDGMDTARTFTGDIGADGTYSSKTVNFPHLTGYAGVPNVTKNKILGNFFGAGFDGKLVTTDDRKGCDLSFYLVHGNDHGTNSVEELKSQLQTIRYASLRPVGPEVPNVPEAQSTEQNVPMPSTQSTNDDDTVNMAEKLRQVNQLVEAGLITEEEAAVKRSKILAEF